MSGLGLHRIILKPDKPISVLFITYFDLHTCNHSIVDENNVQSSTDVRDFSKVVVLPIKLLKNTKDQL